MKTNKPVITILSYTNHVGLRVYVCQDWRGWFVSCDLAEAMRFCTMPEGWFLTSKNLPTNLARRIAFSRLLRIS